METNQLFADARREKCLYLCQQPDGQSKYFDWERLNPNIVLKYFKCKWIWNIFHQNHCWLQTVISQKQLSSHIILFYHRNQMVFIYSLNSITNVENLARKMDGTKW